MKTIIPLVFLVASCAAVRAEDDTAVYDTASPLTYICYAKPASTTGLRAKTAVAISGVSKAAAAVVTSAGHGFPVESRPKVTISGATGTGWTGINGTFTATVLGVDTFSIPVNSAGFGVLGGTVVFTTTAPRTTQPEWKVQKYGYSGGVLSWIGWLGGTPAYNQKCSDAGVATTNQQ